MGEEVVADHDLLISFGYRHILTRDFLAKCLRPVINLHISFLPFNRGAHPNFWAFYEGTQSGVSIHLIDEGIDTGPVLFQEKVEFGEEEVTFSQTNNRLLGEVENLFISNLGTIISGSWDAKPQLGNGTFHYARDLPQDFKGWNTNIEEEIRRLKSKRQE